MADPSPATVSALLEALRGGDRSALDTLFPLVYEELRELAHRQRQRWLGDHTLDTTGLVHEAYLKLLGQGHIDAACRAHFYALAATAMRHILSNYARERRAKRRGGGLQRISAEVLDMVPGQAVSPSDDQADVLLALDEALARLQSVDPRRSSVVECRFFGGMTVEETALALDVSPRTVKRDWMVAQAWLHREMRSGVER
jgi:RNA polymerase sigma factor (TIGR02999 family)